MLRNLFFYGTLRHVPLLEIVLGSDSAALDITPAVLPDHAVAAVGEGPFPTIAHQTGAQAEGVLVRGLGADDLARLDFYDGVFASDLMPVTLADGQAAEVYFPQPGLWAPKGAWSLSAWEADWAALSCLAAREVMSYRDSRSRQEVAAMFSMIRARAGSALNAARSHHGAGTLSGRVEIHQRRRSYAHYFALDDMAVSHERFDGTMSDALDRAVFIAADAAILLPYDPVRDRVLLVEQFRMGPLARGDRAVWQLEPIAGRLDPGEDPEATARREAEEEAGLHLGGVEKVAEVYASPGNSTEFYYIFVGLADLPDEATGIGGLETEQEDIRSHLLGFDELMTLVETLGACNAPLVLASLWLARHRERLRSGQGGDTPEAK